jgi:hypothetical protein
MKLGKHFAVNGPGSLWLVVASCATRTLYAGIQAIGVGANPTRACRFAGCVGA